jgi:hypothetical protein
MSFYYSAKCKRSKSSKTKKLCVMECGHLKGDFGELYCDINQMVKINGVSQ